MTIILVLILLFFVVGAIRKRNRHLPIPSESGHPILDRELIGDDPMLPNHPGVFLEWKGDLRPQFINTQSKHEITYQLAAQQQIFSQRESNKMARAQFGFIGGALGVISER